MDTTVAIIAAALGSGGFYALIQYLLTRHDDKKGIKGRLDKLEKDGLRTQLLLLILMRPEEQQEILTLAQHYFVDLKGDWYMTSIFNKWLKTTRTAEPEWFDSKE